MTKKLRLTLSKTFEFAAAHRLYRPEWSDERNLEVFDKCANPNSHGHNYRLEVSISGETDPITGMIIDSRLLQQLVDKTILKDVDHRNLNVEVEWLKDTITTAENIILAIWKRLSVAVEAESSTIRLEKLVLWETGRIFATLERER